MPDARKGRTDPKLRGSAQHDQPEFDGRYVIERELGRGAMGRVFAARDRKLGREVAIKVLAPGAHGEEALRRFEQEAHAAGSLEHPNVLAVYDVGSFRGQPCIVSELLHGATLRARMAGKPLPLAKALDYALQLVQGLSAAHDKGVIHRDLKPENLFITHEGRLKILDFGIAKLVPRAAAAVTASEPRQPSTEVGAVLGTVDYMSPEQVRGRSADPRSDIFSAGAILYEMLAGRPPFEGDSALETGSAILTGEPPPLPAGVPPELDRIVHRCLEKDPEDRFPTAHELAFALARLSPVAAADRPGAQRRRAALVIGGAVLVALGLAALLGRGVLRRTPSLPPPAVDRRSIAVLPFVNMSSDRESEYFSDGITEELINALANVEGLRVTSRTSAFALKGKDIGIRKIGEELNVATVLEGSVRREGTNVRVTAQLVSAADGYHIWSKAYDRELKNIFALEDELARSIAQALTPKLVRREPAPLVRPATTSTAAHDAYLRGRYFWNQRTEKALLKAIALFQQAIAEDPSYALAHVGLADSYVLLIEYSSAPEAEMMPKAKQAALRALELDGSLGEAHAALGIISVHEYDWSAAEREFRRAIELNPRYATAHHWYALHLGFGGRLAEARIEIDRARQLDPISLVINGASAGLHIWAREYEAAIEDARKTLELEPRFPLTRVSLVIAYAQTGKYAEALAELDAVTERTPWLGLRGYILAISGQRDAARRVLAELADRAHREYVSPVSLAQVHVGLGDKDAAFASLDRAYAERDFRLRVLKVAPFWDPLRSDPRFAQLLKRMRLE